MFENDLLARVYAMNDRLPQRVTIPPGDDLGAVRIGDCDVLVGVDQVIDGVHFDSGGASPERIARKAMTRNLSDVAAMGAVAVGAVVGAVLPKGYSQEMADRLTEGLRQTGEAYDCPVFGGDVSIVEGAKLMMSVTVLAVCEGVKPVLRSGAKVGDAVCVSGVLGGSQKNFEGGAHHLDFEPRLLLGRTLAIDHGVTAMMDLSDGLATDLPRLCAASGVGARIDLEALPVRGGVDVRGAMTDGEDYELCFTVGGGARLPDEVAGVKVTRIGEIEGGGKIMLAKDGEAGRELAAMAWRGWEHGRGEK